MARTKKFNTNSKTSAAVSVNVSLETWEAVAAEVAREIAEWHAKGYGNDYRTWKASLEKSGASIIFTTDGTRTRGLIRNANGTICPASVSKAGKKLKIAFKPVPKSWETLDGNSVDRIVHASGLTGWTIVLSAHMTSTSSSHFYRGHCISSDGANFFVEDKTGKHSFASEDDAMAWINETKRFAAMGVG